MTYDEATPGEIAEAKKILAAGVSAHEVATLFDRSVHWADRIKRSMDLKRAPDARRGPHRRYPISAA